jgi:coiled-coil domain-containing protein 55
MMQKEREREGDEFADKETFVTQAYKDQMAEVRKAEEEERKREELQKKQGGFSSGMTHFYAKLLQDSAQTHDATVAATQKLTIGPERPAPDASDAPPSSSGGPNLTITKPADYAPKSDLELAKDARAHGKEVELNDDNQLVDKRELLSAGLNLSAPNTRHLGKNAGKGKASASGSDEVVAHRAAGTAASRKEINARRAREIREQMMEEEERVQRQKEQQEREATARVVAKRNNEDDIMSAKERYLARKRQKLEQAADTPDTPV